MLNRHGANKSVIGKDIGSRHLKRFRQLRVYQNMVMVGDLNQIFTVKMGG